MRIVVCCETLARGKGGMERIAMMVANEMAERGHDVFVAYQGEERPSYQNFCGVRLLKWRSGDDVAVVKQMRAALGRINPDLFLIFYTNHRLFQLFSMAEPLGIPTAIQECASPTRIVTNNWRGGSVSSERAAWEREVIAAGAARIRLVQPHFASSFPTYLRPQVRAFRNPAFPQPEDTSEASEMIIHVGGLKRNKNLDLLIKAFAPLKDRFQSWTIEVYGYVPDQTDAQRKQIKALIDANGLRERVLLCGPTDDIDREYRRAGIHVVSSFSEGGPNCVLEAMSHGLPSIGFEHCEGTNTLIENGVNGILARSDDPVAGLREALRTLMSDDDLRRGLGARAKFDAAQYDPVKTFDTWERLLEEAASYKGAPDRLQKEQEAVDYERARHALRMRTALLAQYQ